ncbi:PREDICTED: C-C chemokine receptor-like 2 [Ceratotherium simum simum]|uniref:C-C chemokine receptor-like 2 n=1 Tax=Ceratotherium simum simum TaxID=73337 RepID=A0ABM1D4X0_CERSS|nr:PREDICTED: C-C chemokine receptor-like 2 [Ceratotherium simum simum]
MANHTPTEDDYDVLIEDDLKNNEIEQCDQYDNKILSTQLVPPLYTMVFILGLLDNLLAVLILVKHKGLKKVGNIYFLNLALSNLCFLVTLLFWAHSAARGGILGDPMCQILVALSSVGLYSEAFFNVLLTVQRYLVFFDVETLSLVPCGIITSILAWITAVLVSLPEFMFYKPQMESQKYKCFFSKPHFLPADETFWNQFLTLKMNILGLLFPLFVFIFCYVGMRKTLRFGESNYDIYKLVFAVMVVFLLMWGPYNVALFLSAFKEYFSLQGCRSSYNLDRSVQIVKIIATTHCCVNPLLYVFLDKEFRRHLCHLCYRCNSTPLQPTKRPTQHTQQHREEEDASTEV